MKQLKEINVKRIFTYTLVALAAGALYFGLVHLILMAVNLSKSTPSTVYGLTSKRQFALVALGLALVSVIFGWRSFRKSASRISNLTGKRGVIVAIVSGLIAVIGAGLNLATANGGPGSGNGVLGSAQALVLGLTGMFLGGLAMARFRRKKLQS
jgi:membrane protein implicated in regulation of membrane protease activity